MKKLFSRKRNARELPNRRQQLAAERQAEQLTVNNFRQGRTLTGSRSPEVASSNEYNADFLSPRAHVHHLTRHRRRLGWRFLGIVIVVAALFVFLSQSIATTEVVSGQNVAISSTKTAEYNARIQEYLNGHLLQRLHSSLSTDSLTSYLQQKYPEVSSVNVVLTGEVGVAQASIALRKPVARWVVNGQTEYVDGSGTVFDYSPFTEPSVTIVDDNHYTAGFSANLVASHRFLTFVGQVVGDAKERGYTINKAELPEFMTRQLEVHVRGISYAFKLSIDRPAGEQVEDMDRIIRYMKRKGISPRYVDVRIKGEAYYK